MIRTIPARKTLLNVYNVWFINGIIYLNIYVYTSHPKLDIGSISETK